MPGASAGRRCVLGRDARRGGRGPVQELAGEGEGAGLELESASVDVVVCDLLLQSRCLAIDGRTRT